MCIEEKDVVRRQFGRFAERYAISSSQAKGQSLQRLVELAQPVSSDRVLDIATGAGFTAAILAPHVARVVAVDMTTEMLLQAWTVAYQQNLSNIIFCRADAETLPFRSEAFHLVTCRLALHHFREVRKYVSEMARVCRRGGRIAVVDSVVPDDPDVALWINQFEKRRDPSHHWSYPLSQLVRIFADEGLVITGCESAPTTTVFQDWTWRMGVPSEVERELEIALLNADAAVQHIMRPGVENGKLVFQLMQGTILCQKATGAQEPIPQYGGIDERDDAFARTACEGGAGLGADDV